MSVEAQKRHYPIGIISDAHLGTGNPRMNLLAEFLNHATFGKLILNGDIIDGRYLNYRKNPAFKEDEKRVLDALNAKISEGAEVTYLPGNHDEELREMGLFGKKWHGMCIEDSLDLIDNEGRRLYIAHGDQFDRYEKKECRRPSMFLARLVCRFYNGIAKISARLDRAWEKLLKQKRPALAPRLKTLFERTLGMIDNYKNGIARFVQGQNYHGVICGHFHVPEKRNWKQGKLYLNSGDWTENYTAIVFDPKEQDWQLVHWLDERKALSGVFNWEACSNFNKEKFRSLTEGIINAANLIWPGKKAR